MNYSKHYNMLIDRARNRVLEGYTERHHVLPKCLGGTDEENNLVSLTPEEHYVAHQLLIKMHPGHHGLIMAVQFMSVSSKTHVRNNRLYGWVRRQVSEAKKGRKHTPETLEKMRQAKLGKKRSVESIEKTAAFNRGRIRGKYNTKVSPENDKRCRPRPQHVKDAVSKATKARVETPETRLRKSIAAKKGWENRK